ncbi:tyrosine-type recombinase/integrase [Streptomyces sp. NPDC003247]|uniref:tyrosine-type recombinase/integrase n=1 Tax=Streptomyces sp. NPDC003247 TaxID=3364677 RepID=UPI0036A5EA57
MGWDPQELAEGWLASVTYPERVREAYRASTSDWLRTCRHTRLAWDKVAAQHIALWAHRPGAPHSATARRVSAVRSFYAYALAHDAVVYNPAARRPRLTNAAQLTPSGLDPWQTAVLLAAVDRRTSQDRACGYLQLGLGLRSGVLVALTLDDLVSDRDVARGPDTLRLPEPGGGHRLVPLPPVVRDAVATYLTRRHRPRDTPQGGPLFTARAGTRVPRRYFSDLLRGVAEETGVLRASSTT